MRHVGLRAERDECALGNPCYLAHDNCCLCCVMMSRSMLVLTCLLLGLRVYDPGVSSSSDLFYFIAHIFFGHERMID